LPSHYIIESRALPLLIFGDEAVASLPAGHTIVEKLAGCAGSVVAGELGEALERMGGLNSGGKPDWERPSRDQP